LYKLPIYLAFCTTFGVLENLEAQ